jgi:hypothetical protein
MRTDSKSLQTALSGYELLNDPLLNKGTAFSEAERDEFDLFGLLPPHVATLDSQVERRGLSWPRYRFAKIHFSSRIAGLQRDSIPRATDAKHR